MCYLAQKDQYVCQSNQGLAEAVTGVLGSTQFFSRPFYHPRSSRGRFGHPREAAVCAGNFPDSNGISDYCKRQKHSHQTEPVPRCGILAYGFLRLGCDTCPKELLLPFSCKRRGFCPSCAARRMAQTAAHLVEQVIPWVPTRQWVVSV